ncbi:hypothetical protein [Modicisalibacter radicis]|nr:hypothetical protein [Halomonas sp. EAR18]
METFAIIGMCFGAIGMSLGITGFVFSGVAIKRLKALEQKFESIK